MWNTPKENSSYAGIQELIIILQIRSHCFPSNELTGLQEFELLCHTGASDVLSRCLLGFRWSAAEAYDARRRIKKSPGCYKEEIITCKPSLLFLANTGFVWWLLTSSMQDCISGQLWLLVGDGVQPFKMQKSVPEHLRALTGRAAF